jgi:hypothetical protein
VSEHSIELRISQPGRPTGAYFATDADSLRLQQIVYPQRPLPFDIGFLPMTLSALDEPLAVVLAGGVSHPVNTEVEGRLLGALQRDQDPPVLLAVSIVDEQSPQDLAEVPAATRTLILETLSSSRPGDWRWLTLQEAEPLLHRAALQFRESQLAGRLPRLDPAWKPLDLQQPEASYREADRYTAAEYTYYLLPDHFQHYVDEHLAPDERILFAARRPRMLGARRRFWHPRQQLQAGVVILTSQRLLHLAELVPPDSANIRYGFHAIVGALERLGDVALEPVSDALVLRTSWQSASGEIPIDWLSPASSRRALVELSDMLQGFLGRTNGRALLRAALPDPPEQLPPLVDTASNDPAADARLQQEFEGMLNTSLAMGERVHGWALLPKWVETQSTTQALVVTDLRLFLLPGMDLDLPLAKLATLEFTSSIIESSIGLNYVDGNRAHHRVLYFPYPAHDAFRTCFEAARRCMAVAPLSAQ